VQQSFRGNSCNSNFAQHLLETGHSFGKVEDIMEIWQVCKKETHINSVEKLYIYRETVRDNQLNDRHTVVYNRIFNTVLKLKQ
jgi:hypothetical protein